MQAKRIPIFTEPSEEVEIPVKYDSDEYPASYSYDTYDPEHPRTPVPTPSYLESRSPAISGSGTPIMYSTRLPQTTHYTAPTPYTQPTAEEPTTSRSSSVYLQVPEPNHGPPGEDPGFPAKIPVTVPTRADILSVHLKETGLMEATSDGSLVIDKVVEQHEHYDPNKEKTPFLQELKEKVGVAPAIPPATTTATTTTTTSSRGEASDVQSTEVKRLLRVSSYSNTQREIERLEELERSSIENQMKFSQEEIHTEPDVEFLGHAEPEEEPIPIATSKPASASSSSSTTTEKREVETKTPVLVTERESKPPSAERQRRGTFGTKDQTVSAGVTERKVEQSVDRGKKQTPIFRITEEENLLITTTTLEERQLRSPSLSLEETRTYQEITPLVQSTNKAATKSTAPLKATSERRESSTGRLSDAETEELSDQGRKEVERQGGRPYIYGEETLKRERDKRGKPYIYGEETLRKEEKKKREKRSKKEKE